MPGMQTRLDNAVHHSVVGLDTPKQIVQHHMLPCVPITVTRHKKCQENLMKSASLLQEK